MQVKFADGTTVEVIVVNGVSVFAQGAQRDALEIQVSTDTTVNGVPSFDTLNAQTSDPTKTGKLTLIDGENQYIHNNYCIQTEIGIKSVVITPATSTDPEVTEKRVFVTLAQLTYDQVQQAAQQAQIDALVFAILEV